MGKKDQEDTAGRRYSGSRDPEVGASGLMISLLLSGWDPYIIGLWLKSVFFFSSQNITSSQIQSPDWKLCFALKVPWTMQTLVASARKPWICSVFSQSSASQTWLKTRVDSHSVSMHHRGLIEMENEQGVLLQNWRQRPWGGNALDWELGDQDSTCWPTSKLGSKTLYESHVPSPLQTLDSGLD